MDVNYFRILHAINEIKAGAFSEIKQRRCFSAVTLLYVMIDTCASLVKRDGATNSQVFIEFLNQYCWMKPKRFTAAALWNSRSSMIHALSHVGSNHRRAKDGSEPIYYFLWPDTAEQVEARLRARGVERFIVLDVAELKGIAVSGYNRLIERIEEDPDVRRLVESHSTHLAEDLQLMTLLDIYRALEGPPDP